MNKQVNPPDQYKVSLLAARESSKKHLLEDFKAVCLNRLNRRWKEEGLGTTGLAELEAPDLSSDHLSQSTQIKILVVTSEGFVIKGLRIKIAQN